MKKGILLLCILSILAGSLMGCKAEENQEIEKEKTEDFFSETLIENEYHSVVKNNPNNPYGMAFDDNYAYFIASQSNDSIDVLYPKLYRMKLDGSEIEVIKEYETFGSGGNLCVHNGNLYYMAGNRIVQINLNNFEINNNFVELYTGKDIDKGEFVYEAVTGISQMRCIGDMLIYRYYNGYKGTSSGEMEATAIYNLNTGNTIELGEGFVFDKVTSDGEDVYFYIPFKEKIRIYSLEDLQEREVCENYREIKIEGIKDVLYIASNGFVIKNEDQNMMFYDFADTKTLENGENWESSGMVHRANSEETIFTHKAPNILYLTDNMGISYHNYEQELMVYNDEFIEQDRVFFEHEGVRGGGVNGDTVYALGYNGANDFICYMTGTDGIINEVMVMTAPEEESVAEVEKEEIYDLEQCFDLGENEYDMGNGIKISAGGYAHGNGVDISMKLINETGLELQVSVEGDVVFDNWARITPEIYFGMDVARGDYDIVLDCPKEEIKTVGLDIYRQESAVFKLHFTAEDSDFECTTENLLIYFD